MNEMFKNRLNEIFSITESEDIIRAIEADIEYNALRVNTRKISVEKFLELPLIKKLELKGVPWCKEGFYYDKYNSEEDKLSLSPYYNAGLFYFQEPSAMLPGELFEVNDGDIILDLCAAPGGKSTQIAVKNDNACIYANEINNKRVKGLLKNIQLFGLDNVVVMSENPKEIENNYSIYFDKILIDAPCSGEGTFRRDKKAKKEYEKYGAGFLEEIQKEILDSAHKMLAFGGELVYSTCTFNFSENERQIIDFLNRYEDQYEVIEIKNIDTAKMLRNIMRDDYQNVRYADEVAKKALRILPHILEGEGHFACKIRKKKKDKVVLDEGSVMKKYNKQITFNDTKDLPEEILNYINSNFSYSLPKYYVNINDKFYLFKDKIKIFKNELSNIKNKARKGQKEKIKTENNNRISALSFLDAGVYLGESRKDKFIISHSFMLTLKKENFLNYIAFAVDDMNLLRYLKGETLNLSIEEEGVYIVLVEDYPLGYFKYKGGFKNMYPKNWRRSY